MNNIQIIKDGSGNINFSSGGNGLFRILPDSVAQSPNQNNLIYLFDPLYYSGWTYPIGFNPGQKGYRKIYLDDFFKKYSNILPSLDNVVSQSKILNKNPTLPFDYQKAFFEKNGYAFSYEKKEDNSDIIVGNKPSIGSKKNNSKPYGVQERQKALLELYQISYDGFGMLRSNESKTFSCFVNLKTPVYHRSTSISDKIIRSKRGIFLNTREFSIGYYSPGSTRIGNVDAYKFKFEPFSFVFSINDGNRSHSFITDFKFKFNTFYHLAVTVSCGSTNPANNDLAPFTIKIYVNGELQNCAYTVYNPIIKGNTNKGSRGGSRVMSARRADAPIQPGFYKKDGTVFSPVQNEFQLYSLLNNIFWYTATKITIGKSNFVAGRAYNGLYTNLPKRFLNNLSIGVIHMYNTVLLDSEIRKIYDTFGPRYQ